MLSLSSTVIDQKNDLGSTEPIVVALQLDIPSLTEPIRLVRNNENITWNSEVWQAFPFNLDEITEQASGEVQQLALSVANASRVMKYYISEYDTWLKLNAHQPIIARLYIISIADIANETPIKMFEFKVSSFTSNATQVVFNLVQDNIYILKFPPNKLSRKCRFKFGSVECGVTPTTGQVCNKTLSDCRVYNNSTRFGGFPSIGGKLEKVINE